MKKRALCLSAIQQLNFSTIESFNTFNTLTTTLTTMSVDNTVLSTIFDEYLRSVRAHNQNATKDTVIEVKPFTPLPNVVPVAPKIVRSTEKVELKCPVAVPKGATWEKILTFVAEYSNYDTKQADLVKRCEPHSDACIAAESNNGLPRFEEKSFGPEGRMRIWINRAGLSDTVPCVTCNRVLYRTFSWEIGHNRARVNGGTNDLDNLFIQCALCNEAASALDFVNFIKVTTGYEGYELPYEQTPAGKWVFDVDAACKKMKDEAIYYKGMDRSKGLKLMYWFADHIGVDTAVVAKAYLKTLLCYHEDWQQAMDNDLTFTKWVEDLVKFAKCVSLCSMVGQDFSLTVSTV